MIDRSDADLHATITLAEGLSSTLVRFREPSECGTSALGTECSCATLRITLYFDTQSLVILADGQALE